jgi:hypothetical protein
MGSQHQQDLNVSLLAKISEVDSETTLNDADCHPQIILKTGELRACKDTEE